LPSLLVGQLNMDEVESLECMVLLNAAKEVDATVLTSVAPDSSTLVDNDQLVLVGSNLNLVDRDDSDHREEISLWLPTLRASTDVVVENVAGKGDLYFVGSTVAMQLSTWEVLTSLGNAIVDERVKRRCHGEEYCVMLRV